MITSPNDYESVLYQIQDLNRQYEIIQTGDDPIYDIDLNKRVIKAPEFLSVMTEHNAETIYFKMPRYYDHVDLARPDLCLIIQYENANPDPKKRGYIYRRPDIHRRSLRVPRGSHGNSRNTHSLRRKPFLPLQARLRKAVYTSI